MAQPEDKKPSKINEDGGDKTKECNGESTPTRASMNDDSNPQQGTSSHKRRGKPQAAPISSSTSRRTSTGHYRPTMKIPPTKKDSRKLFVGGLPSNVTDKEFREFFEQFGCLIDSIVMFDRDTRRSRGFGFVTFEDPEVSRGLLNADKDGRLVGKVTMGGKVCEIKAAEPKQSSSTGGGGAKGGGRASHDHRGRQTNRQMPPVCGPMDTAAFLSENMNSMTLNENPLTPGGGEPAPAPGMVDGAWPVQFYGTDEQQASMMYPGGYPPVGAIVPGMYYPPPGVPVGSYATPTPVYPNPYVGYQTSAPGAPGRQQEAPVPPVFAPVVTPPVDPTVAPVPIVPGVGAPMVDGVNGPSQGYTFVPFVVGPPQTSPPPPSMSPTDEPEQASEKKKYSAVVREEPATPTASGGEKTKHGQKTGQAQFSK